MPEQLKNIKKFLKFITEYGILTQILLTGIFGVEITVLRVLGLGILWYFIFFVPVYIWRIWKGED